MNEGHNDWMRDAWGGGLCEGELGWNAQHRLIIKKQNLTGWEGRRQGCVG